MSYTAQEMTSAMRSAQSLSRRIGASTNIIDRAGKLDVVKTVTSLDKVVVRSVTAPRRTSLMIETGCEAEQELFSAMPYMQRAAALISQKHPDPIEADEVAACLLNTYCTWHDEEPGSTFRDDRKNLFTRMFGRAFF